RVCPFLARRKPVPAGFAANRRRTRKANRREWLSTARPSNGPTDVPGTQAWKGPGTKDEGRRTIDPGQMATIRRSSAAKWFREVSRFEFMVEVAGPWSLVLGPGA